jgi:hypothetical protein
VKARLRKEKDGPSLRLQRCLSFLEEPRTAFIETWTNRVWYTPPYRAPIYFEGAQRGGRTERLLGGDSIAYGEVVRSTTPARQAIRPESSSHQLDAITRWWAETRLPSRQSESS